MCVNDVVTCDWHFEPGWSDLWNANSTGILDDIGDRTGELLSWLLETVGFGGGMVGLPQDLAGDEDESP